MTHDDLLGRQLDLMYKRWPTLHLKPTDLLKDAWVNELGFAAGAWEGDS